jgi:hypothetical protein
MVYKPRVDPGLISSLQAPCIMVGLEYYIIIYNEIGTDPRVGTWPPLNVDDASKKTFHKLSLLSLFLYVSILSGMDFIWYIIFEKTPD